MRRVLSPNQRLWVISTLLVALIVRALIPAGFMPATDRPFSFQICPDGFPAALLNDAGALAPGGESGGGPDRPDGPVAAHAGHHHGGTSASDSATLVQAGRGNDGTAFSHAGHHHDGAPLAHAGHHDGGPLSHAGHHHDRPAHNHGTASAEHCVFAAAAGVFALAFAPTLSAPAASIRAPEVDYLPAVSESRRFRLPQPRGPPALS